MKAYEITFSPTGGTDRAADLLMSACKDGFERISILKQETEAASGSAGSYAFQEDDICLIAVPSFGGRVPEPAVHRLLSMKGNGARAILTVVYGNRAYDDTLLELRETVKKAGFCPVAAVAAVAEHSIIHRFGAGRPDEEDKKQLTDFSGKLWSRLREADAAREEMEEVEVPGNPQYRAGAIPMYPKTGKECTGCGLCARECPVGAIITDATGKDMDGKDTTATDTTTTNITAAGTSGKGEPARTDREKCISCMRCIKVCPRQARSVNRLLLSGAEQKLKKACATRKNNELFL